jgi:calmodulin
MNKIWFFHAKLQRFKKSYITNWKKFLINQTESNTFYLKKEMENLTTQQIKEYKDLFNLFDKDKDSKINRNDLETVMKELGMNPSSTQIREMMSECDPSNTGAISFSDFISVLGTKLRNTSRSDHLLEAFKKFDPENKGYIPATELKKELTSWGNPLSNNEFNQMLKEINCSETGLFNYTEFVNKMTNSSN